MWMSTDERVKSWFFYVMQRARDMDIPMDMTLVSVSYALIYCPRVRPACNPSCNVKGTGQPHLNVISNKCKR
jgi:hypothetical protein